MYMDVELALSPSSYLGQRVAWDNPEGTKEGTLTEASKEGLTITFDDGTKAVVRWSNRPVVQILPS
jgi:hypothetical protein